MNTDRDKYLTEVMGECWHENDKNYYQCTKCLTYLPATSVSDWHTEYGNAFSTWQGFGKLWDWAQEQEWWQTDFKKDYWGIVDTHLEWIPDQVINPNYFANVVYEFLKGRES